MDRPLLLAPAGPHANRSNSRGPCAWAATSGRAQERRGLCARAAGEGCAHGQEQGAVHRGNSRTGVCVVLGPPPPPQPPVGVGLLGGFRLVPLAPEGIFFLPSDSWSGGSMGGWMGIQQPPPPPIAGVGAVATGPLDHLTTPLHTTHQHSARTCRGWHRHNRVVCSPHSPGYGYKSYVTTRSPGSQCMGPMTERLVNREILRAKFWVKIGLVGG